MKRKSVEVLETRPGNLGPVNLLKITYTDGRESFGVSSGCMLSLFGQDRAWADQYFAVADR